MDFQFLRDCVTALKESPAPDQFDMGTWLNHYPGLQNNWCGTPACVLGHYAVRAASARVDGSDRMDVIFETISLATNTERGFTALGGLEPYQVAELFGSRGCGDARTIGRAIAYIEKFIVRHGGSLEDPKPLVVYALPEWTTVAEGYEEVTKEPACPLT